MRAEADAVDAVDAGADEAVDEAVDAVRRDNRVIETRTRALTVVVAVVVVAAAAAAVEGKNGTLETPTPSRAEGAAAPRGEAEENKTSGSKTVEEVDAVSLCVK